MGHVLIVDNDELLRTVLADALAAVGIQTKQANDGREGLESAKRERPSIIVLDEHMPNMNGQEFIEAIQHEPWFKETRIIVFTSLHDTDLMNHKMLAGVTDYLDKATASPEQVVAIIQKYLQSNA